MKEEASAPQTRLACIHLQSSSHQNIGRKKQSSSTVRTIKKKNEKISR
jgi:hypothetical protein